MSRIDELKRDIEFHKRGMEISKSLLANAEKDLAALEAQERKPKEYIIAVTDTGQIYGQWTDIPYGSTFERITVIEKLPVKVTREMARELNRVYVQASMFNNPMAPSLWIDVLKAAGIDAVPEVG